MRSRLNTVFSSLRVRNYRLFATGQLISLIGGWMQIIAQDWLVLQLSGNSGTALGIVTALQFTPILLLTLYGGKLADRFDKRRLLLLANMTWLVLATAMGLLVVSGAARLWQVMLFAAIWGTVSSLETPVRQSFASELVGPTLLPNALSLSAATFNSARIIGPALAGLALLAFGTGKVFLVNAASYVAPLIALSRMRPGELLRSTAPVAAAEARIVDGLRYVRTRADLVQPLILVAIVGMFGFNFQLTLALMAKKVYHTGAGAFGLFSTALAVGALIGALAGSSRRRRPGWYLVAGAAVVFGVLETLVGFAPGYWPAVALLVPTGFFMIFFSQAANQRVQLGITPAMRGRVMALYVMVFLGTTPLGAPLVGWSAQTFGPRSGLWLGGAVSLLAAGTLFAVHLRRSGGRLRLRLRPLPRLYVAAPPETVGLDAAVPALPAARRPETDIRPARDGAVPVPAARS